MRVWVLAGALWALASSAVLADVSGIARILDGDTIAIGDQKIRLFGMDAPESDQTCLTEHGHTWRCGQWVTQELRSMLHGQSVSCTDRGDGGYGRMLGDCRYSAGNLSVIMVSRGYAWVDPRFDQGLIAFEAEAAAATRGLWAMSSLRPWDHRDVDVVAQVAPNPDCTIKGNISNHGKIFHVEGQQHYTRTRINEARGEQWFCSVTDAIEAGWRAALR